MPRLNPLERAKQKPKSLALALRAYRWEMSGADRNDRDPDAKRACKQDYKDAMAALKGQSKRKVINETCFNCVGGYADPGPKLRVRDCGCTACPLHPVRPWQGIRGRKGVGSDFENALKAIKSPNPPHSSSGDTSAPPQG